MERVHYSQIHLVDVKTYQRTIVHIGATIGRSESEVILEGAGHEPTHLQFAQVNPRVYQASILLKRMPGESRILVDGREVVTTAPVEHRSRLSIDDYEYICELYAWDQPTSKPFLQTNWLTTIGPVRARNEDAVGIYQHRRASFFAVADGVGGAKSGEIISEFTIQYMLAVFHKNARRDPDWLDVLRISLENVNADVRRFGRLYATGAGTTLTAVVIQGWDAYIAHVGDSRLYHWNGGSLHQLTTDDVTFVEGEEHTTKPNLLVKSIGKSDTISPELLMVRLQPGDKLVLCTDGVYENTPPDFIATTIASQSSQDISSQLLQNASDNYSNDNASIISIDVFLKPQRRQQAEPEKQQRVYIGYRWYWSLRLKSADAQYADAQRRRRLLQGASLLVLVFLLCGLLLLRNNFISTDARQTSSATITRRQEQSTQAPQIIIPITTTAVPTVTEAVPTVIPTSTLHPIPTSTLSRLPALLVPFWGLAEFF